MSRRKVSAEVELKVLLASRRRCALCFGLNADDGVKKGQIAHVDHDSSNSAVENLAYLCLPHHDESDATTSQSKGLTEKELLAYRSLLYKRFDNDTPLPWPDAVSQESGVSGAASPRISIELYDRRMNIYRAGRVLITYILQHAAVEMEQIGTFARATEEALFLFDESIEQYLAELHKKAVKLHTVRMLYESEPGGPRRTALVEEESSIVLWFYEQYAVLRQKVRPFLHPE